MMTSRRVFLRQMSAVAAVGAWPGVLDAGFRQAPAVLRTAIVL